MCLKQRKRYFRKLIGKLLIHLKSAALLFMAVHLLFLILYN